MDWNETTDLNRKALQRLVALLLALADLAERARGRSCAVCWSVLWLLRPAEAIARDYVAALTRDRRLAGQPMAIRLAGDSSADAAHLAQAFRALAAALATLLVKAFASRQAGIELVRCASLTLCATGLLAALSGQMPAVARRDSS